ncbi:MAG: molybdopterin-dependent oxidoreductase [Steroidobacteraceae bacterium]
MTEHASYCRLCLNGCPLRVEVADGRAVRVSGVPENPVYHGFTCVKGRAQPRLLRHPARLLRSLKRGPDGELRPVPLEDAVSEIAQTLGRIIERHGPRAVAGYLGTAFTASAAMSPLYTAFMDAIGSPMRFTPGTIDKPGKQIAAALHGQWMAPAIGFDDPEVILLFGINPLVTFTGFPYGNPGRWLKDRLRAGARLFVVDPRRSDVARRAEVHLAIQPGTDVAVIAALLHIILRERCYDIDFADRHTRGIDELSAAVARFEPHAVAQHAGIDVEALLRIARAVGATRRGYIMAGTGPNMSGRGTLIEYLLLNLQTLCGHWLRAGERIRHPGVLAAPLRAKAQVGPAVPAFGFGETMHATGMRNTAAGMPTAALPDEMLLEGEGRVRALISCAGNPAAAWPDQSKAVRGLRSLELLIQIDPWMSATARLAHYVIAPKMWLEVAGTTQLLDWLTRAPTGYGQVDPYGQYVPAIVDAPPDSELIEEWEFFYELGRKMGKSLSVSPQLGPDMPAFAMDMRRRPTTEELLARLCEGSRIPLDEVRRHPFGDIFRGGDEVVVQPADENASERFELAHPLMMKDLAAADIGAHAESRSRDAHQFRLICRRMMHVCNSSFADALPASKPPYNPAFMHPGDLMALGLDAGDAIDIATEAASIPAIVHPDDSLQRGLLSMSFGFGQFPKQDPQFRRIGANTTRLVGAGPVADPYSGQPLMTNIPVRVTRWHA